MKLFILLSLICFYGLNVHAQSCIKYDDDKGGSYQGKGDCSEDGDCVGGCGNYY